MENLQSIFSDPMYSMMASRSGLHPETYWQTLHPKAKEQHLSRVGAPPATYVTEEQYANSQAVGANSGPNAYLSNNPVLAGYDGNPVQPGYPGSGPRGDVAPALSPVTDADVVRNAPGALSAMDQGQVPSTYVTASPPPNPNAAKSYADMNVSDFLRAADGANTTSVGDNHIGAAPGDPLSLPILEADNSYLERLDGETLRELAAEGNVGASAELKKRASAPGYTQPYSMEMPEQAQPVLSANSNPEQNMANFRPAPGGAPAPVLEDPTAAPKAAEAVLSQSNSVGGGSGGGNRTTGSTTQSTSRSVSPSTGNARGSQMGYGKANNAEMLMRVGGAMYSGSLQGDGIGAATREYGQIQDDRRAADTAAYEQSEATRLKEAALRAAAARARAAGAAKDKKGRASAGDLRVGMSKLGTALSMIRSSDGSLTGLNPSALFDRFMGKTIGNEQEAQRLFLNEIGLDSIMKRVSETKGAISNAEMALFGRQVPGLGSQEIVWERWLQRQMQMSEILLSRAEGGTVVDPNAPLSETMPGLTGGSGGSTDYSAADALVGI